MIGNVGRRAVESVVGVFALLGFAYVPLGSKTGLEHGLALLRTAPAQEALAGLVSAATQAKAKLIDALLPAARDTALPLPGPDVHGRGVRPLVPRILGAPQRDTTR